MLCLLASPNPRTVPAGIHSLRFAGSTDSHDQEGEGRPEEQVKDCGAEEVSSSENGKDRSSTQCSEKLGSPLPAEFPSQEAGKNHRSRTGQCWPQP